MEMRFDSGVPFTTHIYLDVREKEGGRYVEMSEM